ncbi:MAG: type VI secretion system baseplate subunit TssE [Acidobacteriota bacterium]
MARPTGNRGFFEKMLSDPHRSGQDSPRWLGDAIRIHLGLLLNTRQGTLTHLPDYGIPHMSAFYADYPDSMLQLQQVITKLIRDYEPRLHNPRVQRVDPSEDEFRASFLITGEIEEQDGERAWVKYRTTFASDGQASLS